MSKLNIGNLSPEAIKILESMNDGIILTDPTSVVTYINSSYSKLVGIKFEDVCGRYLRDVRSGSKIHEALIERKPRINIKRMQDGVESYCDLIPIMDEEELIGGLVVVKDAIMVKEVIKERTRVTEKQNYLEKKIKDLNKAKYSFETIIGKDSGMKNAINLAKKAAVTDSNVLIVGESGTGKEVLAQSIHNYSIRKDNSFVAVNCAAIPENLWESEFFGYSGGAFSGSKKEGKLGLFEIADGGTLFLDEVGEIPLHLQSKLLRVLEERKFRKVGGEEEINVDVRIIAATNQSLKEKTEIGEFRHDLYYRLSVFPIEILPLRQRKEDIPVFINNFLENSRVKYNKNIKINSEAMDALLNYNWTGNVRELRNAMEYAVNFLNNDTIDIDSIPLNIKKTLEIKEDDKTLKELVEDYEKKIILSNINKYGDDLKSKKFIANKLNISLSSLYNKINAK
nr:sigma 54-interacting transcriptional regulator [Sedimentibacter sp.]